MRVGKIVWYGDLLNGTGLVKNLVGHLGMFPCEALLCSQSKLEFYGKTHRIKITSVVICIEPRNFASLWLTCGHALSRYQVVFSPVKHNISRPYV